MRLAAFAALSLMVHAGLLLALSREPAPLASIGEQVISLEIVVGATAPAGVAQTPGEQQAEQAAAPEPQQTEAAREPEEKATEQPQDVAVAPEEKAPEQTAKSDTPEPQAPTQTPPPEEKQTQPPKQAQPTKPAKERRRIDAPTREHASKQAKASAPSTAANNVGVGRSDADSNYAGLVSAHLRRHQQYPADARSRGDQGVATVSFSLDGGGRVTSARLVRGSGVASIDAEVQAMVRRASPFPAPPSGRGVSFTVPVRFQLH
jgi:protein TonB